MSMPIDPPPALQQLAADLGGTITDCVALPDGSGGATMSFPLPKTHWLYQRPADYEAPPMTLRDLWMQVVPADREAIRRDLADRIRVAVQYAARVNSDYGQIADTDPDALVQNVVVGLLGYWTPDGLSGDAWANPPHLRRGL